jgi:hypothetical protein
MTNLELCSCFFFDNIEEACRSFRIACQSGDESPDFCSQGDDPIKWVISEDATEPFIASWLDESDFRRANEAYPDTVDLVMQHRSVDFRKIVLLSHLDEDTGVPYLYEIRIFRPTRYIGRREKNVVQGRETWQNETKVFPGREHLQNIDCWGHTDCEACEKCQNCEKCTNCTSCVDCLDCHDCIRCDNCFECKDCTDCTDLSEERYYISNKKYSKEEYFKKLKEMEGE